ncbi:hypothetical protein HYT25_03350 [Candidatus Pacearchaeota archaeon]|nr:hypothetical protein [Candidatus Pacearchaeota archaeon]
MDWGRRYNLLLGLLKIQKNKMTPLKILNLQEKKEIEKKLNEQFGVDSIPGKIVMRGNERLFLYSGSLDEKEIKRLEVATFIERIGIYFAKIEENGEIRLSIEGTQILGKQIKKNTIEIDEKLLEQWMKGSEILFEDVNKNITVGSEIKNSLGVGGRGIGGGMEKPKGFVIIKYKGEFLGTGKASEEKISNFIPKNRRLREKS